MTQTLTMASGPPCRVCRQLLLLGAEQTVRGLPAARSPALGLPATGSTHLARALGAQCVSSVISILLFAFKNIPTYVEARLGCFFPSPASLAWSITHGGPLLPAQLQTKTRAAVSTAIKLN